MRTLIFTLFIMVLLASCGQPKPIQSIKKPVLLADREAPLGWVSLSIFEDSTFEFVVSDLGRVGDIYSGTIQIDADTILFEYHDSIPKAGKKAAFWNGELIYFKGEYTERLEIELNELTK